MGNSIADFGKELQDLKEKLVKFNFDNPHILKNLKDLEGKTFYHGTIGEYENVFLNKEKVDVFFGKKGTKDNGFGIYLTSNKGQAIEQGRRKQIEAKLKNQIKGLNLDTNIMIVEKYINFEKVEAFFERNQDKRYLLYSSLEINKAYAQFIINNRLGERKKELFIGDFHNLDNAFALVAGGMADGKVGKLITEYQETVKNFQKNTDSFNLNDLQEEFLSRFIEEINKPLKTGKGSQLSIHSNELFYDAVDVKRVLKL